MFPTTAPPVHVVTLGVSLASSELYGLALYMEQSHRPSLWYRHGPQLHSAFNILFGWPHRGGRAVARHGCRQFQQQHRRHLKEIIFEICLSQRFPIDERRFFRHRNRPIFRFDSFHLLGIGVLFGKEPEEACTFERSWTS